MTISQKVAIRFDRANRDPETNFLQVNPFDLLKNTGFVVGDIADSADPTLTLTFPDGSQGDLLNPDQVSFPCHWRVLRGGL